MDRLSVTPATAPPWPAFLRQVESAILARRLFPDGGRILVAVSGGLDSMVLLRALCQLAPAHRWRVTAAHFNHLLRGPAADADERLVRKTARALGIPLVVGRANVRQSARRLGVSLEMAGRERRHQFLARAARRLGIPVVALAHHSDDQVELFFLRLLRGAGGQGLAGMKWSNPSPSNPSITLVRPLLHQSKAALAELARAGGVPFSEDATNASLAFERNRIRHELIPLLRQKYQPALMETVPRLMELAGAESEVVTALAEKWLRARRRTAYGRLAAAVQRRVLQLQLFQLGKPADFDLIERLRASPEKPLALNPSQTILRDSAGLLRLRKTENQQFDPARLRLLLRERKGRAHFDGLTLAWAIERVAGTNFSREPNIEYFDAAKVGARIRLRHWQPGDRFQPIGCASTRKLQDLFVNLKIPRAQRRRRVVAATVRGEIFWVEGLRMSEQFKLTPSTRRRLRWHWRRS
jgi:tRNA(Ile)-lysidine synthase